MTPKIMAAARGRSWHTAPKVAWNGLSKSILPSLGSDLDRMLICVD
jgi:hypothetical protein